MKIIFLDNSYDVGLSSFRKIEGDYLFKNNPESIYIKIDYGQNFVYQKGDIAYTIGLQNVIYCLKFFEQNDLRFCFELYPGFQFNLNIDKNILIKVCRHPLFAGVMTTMPVTYQYIYKNQICENVYYKFGGFVKNFSYKTFQFTEKPKVIFTAYNYGDYGYGKGADIVEKMAIEFKDVNFIMIGGWDVKLPNVTCLPVLSNHDLTKYYNAGDIFLSFNRVVNGVFDGFPTSSAVEAMFQGCCLLATDPLNNHETLINEVHYLEVNEQNITEILDKVLKNSNYRNRIAQLGYKKCIEIYNESDQWLARQKMLEECTYGD